MTFWYRFTQVVPGGNWLLDKCSVVVIDGGDGSGSSNQT